MTNSVDFRLPPLSAKEGMIEKAMLTSPWVKLEFFKHQIISIFGALSTAA
jgi:hypothetical protein